MREDLFFSRDLLRPPERFTVCQPSCEPLLLAAASSFRLREGERRRLLFLLLLLLLRPRLGLLLLRFWLLLLFRPELLCFWFCLFELEFAPASLLYCFFFDLDLFFEGALLSVLLLPRLGDAGAPLEFFYCFFESRLSRMVSIIEATVSSVRDWLFSTSISEIVAAAAVARDFEISAAAAATLRVFSMVCRVRR